MPALVSGSGGSGCWWKYPGQAQAPAGIQVQRVAQTLTSMSDIIDAPPVRHFLFIKGSRTVLTAQGDKPVVFSHRLCRTGRGKLTEDSYSAALAAKVSTTAMFGIRSCGNAWRF